MWESIREAALAMSTLEIGAVVSGLIYVLLAARENIWCWAFGLISSLMSIVLFFQVNLLAEGILYFYYVMAAIYGWWSWSRKESNRVEILDEVSPSGTLEIESWSWTRHLLGCFVVGLLGLGLGWVMDVYFESAFPWIDSQTTVFSFWATFLTTRKVLENWLYWIVIDFVSVGLYGSRGLFLFALLMVLYTGMAIWGYLEWRRRKAEVDYLDAI